MTAKAFVDSDILIYAHDQHAGAKYFRAQEVLDLLWREKTGVLSIQVLQEFCVNVRRKVRQPISRHEVREAVQDFLQWEVVINTPESLLAAMDMEAKYQLSFWDAMIVQAAGSADCEILYSEDFAHGRKYEGLLVVNPFQ